MENIKQLLVQLEQAGIRLFLQDGALKSKAKKGAITPDIARQIKQHKSAIIEALTHYSDAPQVNPVTPREDLSHYPVSFAQQRLYTLDQIQGGSAEYHMPMVFRLSGQLDVALIERVFREIVSRHEVLRAVFRQSAQGMQQSLLDPQDFTVEESHLTSQDEASGIERFVREAAEQPFNLAEDFMLRVRFATLPAGDAGVLFINMHHIATDGWSMDILIREFFALFHAFGYGQPNPLPELSIQYADYAQWQRDWLQGEVLDAQLSYWQQQLAELPRVHALGLDYPRPEVKTYQGEVVSQTLSAQLCQQLASVARRYGLTPFMLIHGALALVLSRNSNHHDIVIGTPVANRRQVELESLIGFFVNTLILRVNTQAQPLGDYLAQLRQVHLDAQSHQDLPFEKLVEVLKVPRSTAHSPLFQIMLTTNSEYGVRDAHADTTELAGLSISPLQGNGATTKFDLDINASVSDDGGAIEWTYDVALFTRERIETLAQHLNNTLAFLAQLNADSTLSTAAIPMLTDNEITQLSGFNDNAIEYPQQRCIHELFEAQAEQAPERVAVQCGDVAVSYGELNARANQLAHYLRFEHHIAPDCPVGICLERGVEMVVAMLAVLKAGGAYIPLDPAYPEERLAYLIEDASLKVVLTQQTLTGTVSLPGTQRVMLDDLITQPGCAFSHYSTANIGRCESGVTEQHLAYLIYTSGSTGKPKGVMIEHRNTVAMLYWARAAFSDQALRRVLASTSLNFDLSVYEIFLPLSFGFEVVVVKNALALADQPLDISLINTVPSAMKALLDVGALPASLTTVNLAGEPLTAQQVNQIFAALPEAEVCNLYGPSEDTTYSTCARFSTQLESVPDIGYVIANSQAYVLGEAMERLPIGCVGELYLGGAGVARGYLNRPELTEERFIANPYYETHNTDCSPRLYRTGDLVRYRQDGRLEFIGRSDDQVKIRGFRIELGEIEHRLNQLDDVALSQVLARTLADSQQQLVAYVQPCITCETTQDETQQAAWISDIKLRLGQQLPAHMVPGLFVVMPQWPLTPNGKIDKKALPAPDALQQSSAQYVAPETELAQLLASLWAELLGLEQDKISATANFFELGGHSLLIMQLLAKLQQHNLSCSAQQLFQAVDLAAMAEVICEAGDTFAIPENKIPPQCDAITPDMLTLATLEQSEIDAIAAATSGGMRNIQDMYPLAPLQEGVLFVHTLNPEHDPYVTTASFEFTSAGKLSGFVTQLNWLIQRHDVLRTAIFWRGRQQAMQVVMREARLPVTELALREGNIEAQFTEYVASGPHGFDLESAPLIQLVVTPEDELGRVFAMLKFHHLITDHVSLEILMSELEADNVLALPAPLPYREFIARSMAQSAELDTEAFFTEQLGDIDTPTLPFDLAQVTGDGNSVVEFHSTLSDTQSQLIRTLCKRHQCSPAALFHLAWAQVLSACCGRDEVVFGTVMSGRMNGMAGIERMMGMLINTLPLRVSLGHQAAHVALKEVNDALQALLPYEQVSLAEAQSYSGIDGNTPLFSAIVNYRHSATQSEPAGEQDTSPGVALLSTRERTNYPFDLSVNDLGEGDSFSLDYQIEQSVSAARIAELMHTALDALVEALNEHSEQSVATLAVLSEPELTQLSQGQSDEASYPRSACIHEVFELHARATPDSIALRLNEQTLSYGELNAKANQLARYLREAHQVGSGTLVGLCIGRSVEMIVASLAILKAGGAYVPLDPNYPQSRLAYMLEDTQLSVILTERAQQETLAFSQVTKLMLDDADTPWSALSKDNLTRADALTPQSLAYVIYTSGSTGTPKGVMTPHRAVNRLVHAPNFMALDSQTVFLQSANIAFDAATLEIWGPLLNGGRCVLYPDSLITLDGLNQVLRTQEITALWLTSGLFTEWSKVCNELAADTLALQNVLAGGDVLNPQAVAAVQRALPEVTVINGYGPTENTTFTCCYPVPQHSDLSSGVPIGRAVQGDQLLILTPHGRRVPQGVVGELCVGGDGLALGYLNQPALSKERFIRNPYQTQGNQPETLYRTGDLVRCNTDGLIEYTGRVDAQIKIRGFRVELGEIERQLEMLDDVAAALVTIKTRTGGDKQLVAYVELNCGGKQEEQGAHIQGLAQALAAQLPAYMIPAAFVLVQDWPLTPNGKIDRHALPEADFSLMQAEYVAPASELETQLVALWSELLDLPAEQISTQANFFELGGHSLLVMKLLQALNQHLEIELQIADLYRCENIQQIAGFIESVQAIHDQALPAQQDNNEFEDFEL